MSLLLLPGGPTVVARLTRERPEVLEGHRQLLHEHGLSYLRDRRLFLSNNTDGLGNPLSKVYGREKARELFARFEEVQTTVRFLHLRSYPGGGRLASTALAKRLGSRWGWHLWIDARKAQATDHDSGQHGLPLVRAERPKCRNGLLEVVDSLVIAERKQPDRAARRSRRPSLASSGSVALQRA